MVLAADDASEVLVIKVVVGHMQTELELKYPLLLVGCAEACGSAFPEHVEDGTGAF